MNRLSNPKNTIEIIKKYDFVFQKKYGQNFLIDAHVIDKIIEASDIGKQDCILEIGPGIGTMTQYLAEAANKVIAVEIDRNLIPILEDTLQEYRNVIVINSDILKTNINELAQMHNCGRPLKVVANLPYYITTPIIMGILEQDIAVESVTVMVQKEVAVRMQAGPGTKDYGALSLAVQYYARPELVANVPPNCFMPRPNVGSAVIRLVKYLEKPIEAEEEAFLFAIIRAAFNQRRKTLVNSLNNASGLRLEKEWIEEVLCEMGLSSMIRGEALSLSQFADLSDRLKNRKI